MGGVGGDDDRKKSAHSGDEILMNNNISWRISHSCGRYRVGEQKNEGRKVVSETSCKYPWPNLCLDKVGDFNACTRTCYAGSTSTAEHKTSQCTP